MGQMDEWMDGWDEVGQMDGWMDGWIDRRTDVQMDGWTDGWMDVSAPPVGIISPIGTVVHAYLSSFLKVTILSIYLQLLRS